jgi:PBP1b-binding outer membrane lipoprotein LpoB
MMKCRISTSYYRYAVALMLLVLLNGCSSTAGYKKPISDFQNASSVVTESARVYVTQLNKTQRNAYIDRQVSDEKQITLDKIEELQAFSPQAIETRLGALNELSKYGDLLGKLANSDAPENITSNAEDLANSLKKLENNINNLGESGNTKFKGAFSPVALLIGEVARFAVEKKIQEAIEKAILGGEKPIKNLIIVIRDDLVMAYQLKRNAVSDNRVIYIDGYEKERLKGRDVVSLRKRGEEIKSVLDVWETLPTSNPSEGLDAMATAHSALVDYAKSPKKAEDLAAFAAQMETFVARAKRVGNAVRQLQQLNNE